MSNLPLTKQVVVDVFIFLAVCLPLLVVMVWGEPVQSGFWCRDESVRYPYKPDTVNTSLLLVMSFGGPFLVMTVTETIRAALKTRLPRRFRGELLSLAKAYGAFLFGVAANCILTDTLKFSIGRPRPHFIDLCKPNFDKINCTSDDLGLDRFVLDYECTNTEVDHRLLREAKLSFPSGHASLSMFSALFTIFYLQLRMEIKFSHLLRPTLQLCLIILAVLCCVTRIIDHKHFPSDVVAGACLGTVVAWLSFYKIAHKLIPTIVPDKQPSKAALARATSVESEPQTPTPLLRPERLVLNQGNNYRSSCPVSKADFANNV
ncbi:phospholipid phosphatase 1 [Aplysia californica]|uniref:Phospholipid phosphatase 1 n=1 Tax=Aplysia californica TaxID=6500 RepID=A0ABM1VZR8_APLCA|nr:phospholipid phosphatase 1 [Aplysia californica]